MKQLIGVVAALMAVACSSSPGGRAIDTTVATKPLEQCPEDTFVDNASKGAESVTVSANADIIKQVGGAAVGYTGSGANRLTCRQKCPGGSTPHVEESESAGTKKFLYKCDPLNGETPKFEYEETHKEGEKPKGEVKKAE